MSLLRPTSTTTLTVQISKTSLFNNMLLLTFLVTCYAAGLPVFPNQAVLRPSLALPGDNSHRYSLPMFDLQPWERVDEIRLARKGYLYGSPLLGNTSFFPTGALGDAMVARDRAQWFRDVGYVTSNVYHELDQAAAALMKAAYPKTPGRWTAACTAYFFIHPRSGDFLPLAIKTNMGSDLTYTALDDANDWLCAKMAFNMNDLFHSQLYHLAHTHDVAEPVHQTALRTMSARHPVRGYLNHLMNQAYAVRSVGEEFLFNEGGFYDSSFALPNWAGKKFTTDAYWEHAGHFRATDFYRDLATRGLLNCSYGPPLRSFPFYDTVAPMVKAIEDFTSVFVETYYPESGLMGDDHELQDWIREHLFHRPAFLPGILGMIPDISPVSHAVLLRVHVGNIARGVGIPSPERGADRVLVQEGAAHKAGRVLVPASDPGVEQNP
ncbi:lipoxygenase [Aspergillus flavus]|uniref:Manganese lipoxygenase n=2 Tax=Aspergillus subgen. Circumdati TaxID=2720871 RepID=A0A5N6HHK0_ASPFL|nr:lipoxygenase [Aspergillus flavus]